MSRAIEAKIRRALARKGKGEAALEARCVKYLKRCGLVSRKMNGLGFRDWPDRLILPRRGQWVGSVPGLWVELKKPGEAPTASQAEMHQELVARGQRVAVINNYEAFVALVNGYFNH